MEPVDTYEKLKQAAADHLAAEELAKRRSRTFSEAVGHPLENRAARRERERREASEARRELREQKRKPRSVFNDKNR